MLVIEAELKLRVKVGRDHHVVILPNVSALSEVPDVDAPLYSWRPIEVLRVGDVLEDCELVDRFKGDRFNIPAGVRWKCKELQVEPAAHHYAWRIYTLVRVP